MGKYTLKDRQDVCEDLFDACQIDPTLLTYIIDDYVYRLTDDEIKEYGPWIGSILGEDDWCNLIHKAELSGHSW